MMLVVVAFVVVDRGFETVFEWVSDSSVRETVLKVVVVTAMTTELFNN